MALRVSDRATAAEASADQFLQRMRRLGARHRYMFVFLKMIQLLVAAAIPVAAAADASNVVVATLGAGVVLLQGLDQLTQLGRRYVASTNAEARMQRETTLWKTGAGSYATAGDPDLHFAERVVEIESEWRAQFSELALESLHPEDQQVRDRAARH